MHFCLLASRVEECMSSFILFKDLFILIYICVCVSIYVYTIYTCVPSEAGRRHQIHWMIKRQLEEIDKNQTIW